MVLGLVDNAYLTIKSHVAGGHKCRGVVRDTTVENEMKNNPQLTSKQPPPIMSATASAEPESPFPPTPAVPLVDGAGAEAPAAAATEEAEGPVDIQQKREEFQKQAKTYLIEQLRHVVVPSFAKWFDFNDIHSIEKRLFPDFFPKNTSEDTPKLVYKTPEAYRNIRDFMINLYRINPVEYLTVTAVRRNLAGDVSTIIRVHQFLEKWGLINYQIDPRTRPTLVGPQYTGHFQVTLDTPKGLTPFVPENVEVKLPSPENSVEPETAVVLPQNDETEIPLNLEIRRNVYDSSKDSGKGSVVQYFCNVCNRDASSVRYHNLKSKAHAANPNTSINNASVLCTACYEQGLFPLNFLATDFVKLQLSGENKDTWSEQEVLLLLEAVEVFGTYENGSQTLFANSQGQWDKIAEYVGTKTREQCLIKFLQLPIEDRYLNKLVRANGAPAQDAVNKETIVQEVAKRLVSTKEGEELLKANSVKNLEESVAEQTNLINQVTELTLEKVQAKLSLVGALEANLIKTENLLNLQRKQVLVERWLQFDKIQKFKEQNTNPELALLLDDLLTPVTIHEVNKAFNAVGLQGDDIQVDKEENGLNTAADAELPISVTKPKSYQFWSA